jgi:hypothetical protein
LAVVLPRAAAAQQPDVPGDTAAGAVRLGLGLGVVRVDLPDPDLPGERFGTKLHYGFGLGYTLRPWLELGADVGLGFRWAPFVRTGAGGATLSLSGPDGLGWRRNDWTWNGGAGLELRAHPRLVLRAEGLDLVQWASGGARHHAIASLALVYVLPASVLASR